MRRSVAALLPLSFALTVFGSAAAAPRTAFAQSPNGATKKGPLRVALLVDTSDGIGAAIAQIRSAVVAFADALPPEHELLLVTTGRRTQVRVPPTLDRKKVDDSARGITGDHGTTPLMDALLEVDQRFLRNPGDRVPAFVVITGDGSESSAANEQAFNKWLTALTTRDVSFDAVVLKFKGSGLPEAIAGAVAQATHGRVETTTAVNTLADKLRTVAERLGREYAQ